MALAGQLAVKWNVLKMLKANQRQSPEGSSLIFILAAGFQKFREIVTWTGGTKIIQKSMKHLEILGAKMVKWCTFQNEDLSIWGAFVRYLH